MLAQTHSKKWQKSLQYERDQRIRLEETLEQLAKQHNHLERAFRGATVLPANTPGSTGSGKGKTLGPWGRLFTREPGPSSALDRTAADSREPVTPVTGNWSRLLLLAFPLLSIMRGHVCGSRSKDPAMPGLGKAEPR